MHRRFQYLFTLFAGYMLAFKTFLLPFNAHRQDGLQSWHSSTGPHCINYMSLSTRSSPDFLSPLIELQTPADFISQDLRPLPAGDYFFHFTCSVFSQLHTKPQLLDQLYSEHSINAITSSWAAFRPAARNISFHLQPRMRMNSVRLTKSSKPAASQGHDDLCIRVVTVSSCLCPNVHAIDVSNQRFWTPNGAFA